MQFGTICGKKIRIKSFLQPFRRREGSSFANILFPQSLVRTTGVLQHQGLMERADGAIRSRWTLILVNVQKLANNYPPLRSTGSNHKSNLKQREKMIFVICKHQLLFPKISFKNIFVEHLLENTRSIYCGGWGLLSKICIMVVLIMKSKLWLAVFDWLIKMTDPVTSVFEFVLQNESEEAVLL